MSLERYVAERNADLAQTAAIQGVTGLGCLVVTAGLLMVLFSLFIGLGWFGLRGAFWFAVGATALYLAVATYSAWRRIDPLASLAPLTRAEADRRAIEDALADLTDGPLLLREEAVAGLASGLVAGPANLFAAWRTWRRRVLLDRDLSKGCEALLARAAAPEGAPVASAPRSAAALVQLGLARVALGEDGALWVRLSPKGKQLV